MFKAKLEAPTGKLTSIGIERKLEEISSMILAGQGTAERWAELERLQDIRREKLFSRKPSENEAVHNHRWKQRAVTP